MKNRQEKWHAEHMSPEKQNGTACQCQKTIYISCANKRINDLIRIPKWGVEQLASIKRNSW